MKNVVEDGFSVFRFIRNQACLRDGGHIPTLILTCNKIYVYIYICVCIYMCIYIYIYIKLKCSRYRPGVVLRVGRGITLLFHDCGTRRG